MLALQEVDRNQPRSHNADLTAVAAEAMGAREHRFVAALAGSPGATWMAATGEEQPDAAAYGVAMLSRASRCSAGRWSGCRAVAGRGPDVVPRPPDARCWCATSRGWRSPPVVETPRGRADRGRTPTCRSSGVERGGSCDRLRRATWPPSPGRWCSSATSTWGRRAGERSPAGGRSSARRRSPLGSRPSSSTTCWRAVTSGRSGEVCSPVDAALGPLRGDRRPGVSRGSGDPVGGVSAGAVGAGSLQRPGGPRRRRDPAESQADGGAPDCTAEPGSIGRRPAPCSARGRGGEPDGEPVTKRQVVEHAGHTFFRGAPPRSEQLVAYPVRRRAGKRTGSRHPSVRSVCSRTCLTRTEPSPCRSSSRCAPSGAQPAPVRNRGARRRRCSSHTRSPG